MGAIAVPGTIKHVSAHRRRALRLEHAPFFVLYSLALRWMLASVGEPYRVALAHHEDAQGVLPLAARKAAEAAVHARKTATVDEWNMPQYDGPARGVVDEGEDEDVWDEGEALEAIAEGEAEGEHAEEAEYDLEELIRASEVPLPNPMMPSFWAVLFTMGVATAHALLLFAQRWSVRFRAWVQFVPAGRLDAQQGTWALVQAHAHQGKAELVPLQQAAVQGEPVTFFIFHRQKFLVGESGDVVTEVLCPTDRPLAEYHASRGHATRADADGARERYGDNSLNIPTPSFAELYKEQIMGPVPVFQIFCAALWLLDEYPKYALFNMMSILAFEGSTVFTKQRNMNTLRGMSNKAGRVRVYREGEWVELSTDALLPGDIFELACGTTAAAKGGQPQQGQQDASKSPSSASAAEPNIPCDCLILSGTAVVNEASLTGESTPLVKDAAPSEGASAREPLAVDGEHKSHVLFSGTTLMQARASEGARSAGGIRAPSAGCLCVALRTGFLSSQGRLIRMIEYSSEQVQSDTKETLALLGLLLGFALLAAAHVMSEGLKAGKRSQYELVLRCVLIITRVVPPELPLQTAMAVNTALMTLMKAQIFCTEPFRIPYGGRVDACLFDKTGTITTDHLVLAGVAPVRDGKIVQLQTDIAKECSVEAGAVLGACHALAEVAGRTVGDPIETAALRGCGWKYDAARSMATPKTDSPRTPVSCRGMRVTVLHRYAFSSKLQRMSVVARVKADGRSEEVWVLTKGSPEAVQALLGPGETPGGYEAAFGGLSIEGMRVLGMGYRRLDDAQAEQAIEAAAGRASALPREDCERGLSSAGLVAFECPVRRDSNMVIQNLRNGAHKVIMATGDNALTGLHVARATCITGKDASKARILVQDADGLGWVPAASTVASAEGAEAARAERIAYRADEMVSLSESGLDLCMTGPSFRAAVAADEATLAHVQHVKVYARMAPEDKETVLRSMREHGLHTLMCGDGANDVGALKQAHVGVALLSGFAGANTTKAGEKALEDMTPEEHKAKALEIQTKAKERAIKARIEAEKDKKELQEMQKVVYEAELKKETDKGNAWAAVTAMKTATQHIMAEQKRRIAERRAKYGGGLAGQAAMLTEDAEGEVPMVKLGDASVAAPFTSKLPSITSTVDIVRQGRCTLVSSVQMQQVLALNCLITAYSLSALYLDGVRSSEAMMIGSGMLLMVASIAFSYARPVQKLSPVKPLQSVFHPANFLSIVGQLAIHLYVMVWAIQLSKSYVPDEVAEMSDVKIMTAAELRREEQEAERLKQAAADDAGNVPLLTPFKPSLLSTVVFLVETAQQVAVMFVNYKGRPFMVASTENWPMMYSLAGCAAGTLVCAFEVIPWLNTKLDLYPMPDIAFKQKIIFMIVLSIGGSLLWDRLCMALFAPRLLWAGYYDAYMALPTAEQGIKFMGKLLLYGGGGAIVLGSGMTLPAMGLYWWWRSKQQRAEQQRVAQRMGAAAAGGAARGGAARRS